MVRSFTDILVCWCMVVIPFLFSEYMFQVH
jgi:hypothetical protein